MYMICQSCSKFLSSTVIICRNGMMSPWYQTTSCQLVGLNLVVQCSIVLHQQWWQDYNCWSNSTLPSPTLTTLIHRPFTHQCKWQKHSSVHVRWSVLRQWRTQHSCNLPLILISLGIVNIVILRAVETRTSSLPSVLTSLFSEHKKAKPFSEKLKGI